jgi:polysaccharide pyruvyl transferase WcaK-like protein
VRIAFISPCGYGNLGDVAIQDTFITGVRTTLGEETEIVGITQNPPDTEERHHVRALPMDTLAFRLRAAPTGQSGEAGAETGTASAARRLVGAAKLAVKEAVHWGIALREMRRTEVLVVSGGGQLDEHWGGPWRTPYALWKWSLAARLFRRDVVVLSVGAGTTDSRLARFFLRSTLGRARYASFRDEQTAARVRALRLSHSSRVVPDLAFGHEGRRGPHAAGERPARIALSPIAYLDPVAWPAKDARAYRSSIERTAELVRLALARGYDVVLCTSGTPDIRTATDVYELAVRQAPPDGGTLVLAETRTPGELLDVFAEADVAVASRLHGLVIASLAATPQIALSYDWKVDEHMRTVGLEPYTFPIGDFQPEAVVAAVEAILGERGRLSTDVAARCEALARAVQAQFEEVFASADPAA